VGENTVSHFIANLLLHISPPPKNFAVEVSVLKGHIYFSTWLYGGFFKTVLL
jgi:hypothetical protein